MNRKSLAYPYLILGVCLFCWISLPKKASDPMRSLAVASLAPSWKWGGRFLGESGDRARDRTEISRLELENQTLRNQIDTVYEWLVADRRIAEQVALYKELVKEENRAQEPQVKSFFQRRSAQLQKRLHRQLSAFPAQVIYRDPSSWSSSIWVNAGEDDNCALGEAVIAKNSPVIADGSLVGVVDYVGKKQSRIRLITDSGLSPAVRAVRGAPPNRELAQHLETLSHRLAARNDLFSSAEEQDRLLSQIKNLQEKMGKTWEDGYLAKGELHGSSAPFWRSRGMALKGVGFNFDYPDEEGPRSPKGGGQTIPLLKEGDLLLTSGLDGVFPAGLKVAVVTRVAPLEAGKCTYELEARSTASNLNDLQTIFVLPSLSSD